ncbi:olfactomedin-like protein 2B [Hyperolius riggenbachi]|uniref:olfactomedin-like protein 2B n=1 Tax=Hyperolius riggenbachi TaxID=752182 RepID=UPI0035A283D3
MDPTRTVIVYLLLCCGPIHGAMTGDSRKMLQTPTELPVQETTQPNIPTSTKTSPGENRMMLQTPTELPVQETTKPNIPTSTEKTSPGKSRKMLQTPTELPVQETTQPNIPTSTKTSPGENRMMLQTPTELPVQETTKPNIPTSTEKTSPGKSRKMLQTPTELPVQETTQPNIPTSTEKILEDEDENQENILSQLLGDYDKVKAVSEGSNCKCKCIVKPVNKELCEKVPGAPLPDHSYTVETITSGDNCKCACVLPPSAANPCEGEFRLRKLQEAERNGYKLSRITEMLEGSLYGLDLLKLHTVTTKIIDRIDKLEKIISKNITQEQETLKSHVDKTASEINATQNYNATKTKDGKFDDVAKIVRKNTAAVYTDKRGRYEERFLRDEQARVEIPKPRFAQPQQVQRKPLLQRQLRVREKPSLKPIKHRITFYKAKDTEEDSDLPDLTMQNDMFSGDNTIDLLIEDQLIKHETQHTVTTESPLHTSQSVQVNGFQSEKRTELFDARTGSSASSEGSEATVTGMEPITQDTDIQHVTTNLPKTDQSSTSELATTAMTTSTKNPTVLREPVQTSVPTDTVTPLSSQPPLPTSQSQRSAGTSPETRENKEVEDELGKVIGRCKDTLSTISGPTSQNTYGRNEGAWMKDPLAKDEKIYVTNYYYGNTLVEYRNLENFKQGRWSNSYKLTYSWIGTGHVIYNGSFYYNRAFTRNIIKYDMKQRYVAAWAMLHDVVYEEATPWRWRGHSDIDFAIDENGLWVIYPAIDEDGFQQEVIVLSRLNAADLSTQKETTWRTGLRKEAFSNCFVICGVLYAVDSNNKKTANISYAFDTHTNTQLVPRLLFENKYSYTTQIDYNPKDRLLYAWDNGHQVTYNVIFAY